MAVMLIKHIFRIMETKHKEKLLSLNNNNIKTKDLSCFAAPYNHGLPLILINIFCPHIMKVKYFVPLTVPAAPGSEDHYGQASFHMMKTKQPHPT